MSALLSLGLVLEGRGQHQRRYFAQEHPLQTM